MRIVIIGKQGEGKTQLAEKVLNFLNDEAIGGVVVWTTIDERIFEYEGNSGLVQVYAEGL